MAADVRVIGGGSVFVFVLATPEAQSWVSEHVSEDRQMFGDGLAVEHRYAAALLDAMQEDGLLTEAQI